MMYFSSVKKMKMNVKKVLGKAQDEGEVFLCTLSKQELEKAGFDSSPFGSFSYADIYLQWVDDEFKIKYVFDGDPSNTYYEKTSDIGKDVFNAIIEAYISRI